MTAFLIVTALTLLALSGLCAGLETGFVSIPRHRVQAMVEQETQGAEKLARKLDDLSRAVTTLLIGTNVFGVALSTTVTALSIRLVPDSSVGQGAISVVAAVVVLLCGEYLPKLAFATRPVSLVLNSLGFYQLIELVFAPLVEIFARLTRAAFGRQGRTSTRAAYRDRLRKLVAETDDATRLTKFERRLIDRVLMLQTLSAGGLAHDFEKGCAFPELRISSDTRGDDILPILRRAHRYEATVYDSVSGLELGRVTEEDVLVALTGVLGEERTEV